MRLVRGLVLPLAMMTTAVVGACGTNPTPFAYETSPNDGGVDAGVGAGDATIWGTDSGSLGGNVDSGTDSGAIPLNRVLQVRGQLCSRRCCRSRPSREVRSRVVAVCTSGKGRRPPTEIVQTLGAADAVASRSSGPGRDSLLVPG